MAIADLCFHTAEVTGSSPVSPTQQRLLLLIITSSEKNSKPPALTANLISPMMLGGEDYGKYEE